MLQQIHLKNIFSFGPKATVLDLRALNVVIGPNGSGKSNLLETISLLRSTTRSLADAVRECGGVDNCIWKGASSDTATIATTMRDYEPAVDDLEYSIAFASLYQKLVVVKETVALLNKSQGNIDDLLYSLQFAGDSMIRRSDRTIKKIDPHSYDGQRSILSAFRDPDEYPEISHICDRLEQVRLYRDWSFGRTTPARLPQRADGRSDYLESDCSNLGMVLNRIRRDPAQKEQLIERLNDLYPGIKDVDVSIEGGTVQVFLTEGKYAMPATRLSDGTLRYLCLLAILLHPTPPPLICIEEPELGLHPDVMPAIGKLLKQASERTQLIVTTHSEVLVDSLSDSPEDVVVCEKHDGCTTFNRLDADRLKVWLEEYTLGTLWRRGDLGGNRW